MINNVAGVILYHFLDLNVRILSEGNASDGRDDVKPFSKCLNEVERIICYAPESKGDESINGHYLGSYLEDFMSRVNIISSNGDICPKRLVFSMLKGEASPEADHLCNSECKFMVLLSKYTYNEIATVAGREYLHLFSLRITAYC